MTIRPWTTRWRMVRSMGCREQGKRRPPFSEGGRRYGSTFSLRPRAPVLDPQGRDEGVAGDADPLDVARQDRRLGAEVERQHRQLGHVDALDLAPDLVAPGGIELAAELLEA